MKKKTMKEAVGSYFLEETLYTSEKKKKPLPFNYFKCNRNSRTPGAIEFGDNFMKIELEIRNI